MYVFLLIVNTKYGDYMNKNNRGNTILTTPIILAVAILFVAGLIVVGVKVITPYIWYEKYLHFIIIRCEKGGKIC